MYSSESTEINLYITASLLDNFDCYMTICAIFKAFVYLDKNKCYSSIGSFSEQFIHKNSVSVYFLPGHFYFILMIFDNSEK